MDRYKINIIYIMLNKKKIFDKLFLLLIRNIDKMLIL